MNIDIFSCNSYKGCQQHNFSYLCTLLFVLNYVAIFRSTQSSRWQYFLMKYIDGRWSKFRPDKVFRNSGGHFKIMLKEKHYKINQVLPKVVKSHN